VIALIASLVALPAQPPVPPPAPPAGVVVVSPDFSATTQWDAIAASPRVTGAETGTAVAVGVRDGLLYLLTANHVVAGSGERSLEFFTRDTYRDIAPRTDHILTGAEVVLRIVNADVALMTVPLGKKSAPKLLKLPKPGERPRRFPVPALSVGCGGGGPPTCRLERVMAKQLVRPRSTTDSIAFYWNVAEAPVEGRSGGPLIDTQGRLIGICAAAQKGTGYFSHLDEIHAALKKENYQWLWETVGAR
jgi:S1-C subfamily serine protease